MMLDTKRVVEAEFVAQLQLAPQLLVTLLRRHSGLGPDVGEMGEFHGIERLTGSRDKTML
jgi:hypothetical protein